MRFSVPVLFALISLPGLVTPATATSADSVNTGAQRPAFPAFGSGAPEFKPAYIIRGPIPKDFSDARLHLVAMFSTRLSSSLKSIPHLNDIHNRFGARGVAVTGVSVWEESDSAVKDFLTERGATLAFPVCFDGRDAGGTVSKIWQERAGINAVPYLFAIRRDTVLWHGSPEELRVETIESMLAGTYEPAAEMKRRETLDAARAKATPICEAIEDLLADNKADAALAKCDELEKMLPECDRALALQMRAECHFTRGDFKTGFGYAARFADAHPNDAQLHAMLALQIISEPRFKERDFALAKRCIERALTITPVEPYRLLKARVYYTAGDITLAENILKTLPDPKNTLVAAHMKLIREAVAARQPWPIPPAQDCACGAH